MFCDGRYSQVELKRNPDFSLIAAAYGVEYYKVSDQSEVKEAVENLHNPDKVVIVEFLIDPNANVIPIEKGGEES